MARVALTGGAYQAHSVIASAQRSVNLYSEPMPEGQREPSPSAHYPTPGTRFLGTIGPGPIRGIRQATTGALYVVSGNGVYVVDTTTWAGTHLGDITPGLRTPVSMVDNTLDMVIVDGTATGWHVQLAGNAFSEMIQSGTLAPTHTTGSEPVQAGIARYTPFTATFDAAVTEVTVSLATGYHGHLKCSIYDSNGTVPGSEQFTAQERVNPNAGLNTLIFTTPVKLTKGSVYWVATISDTTAGAWNVDGSVVGFYSLTDYSVYPINDPVVTAATGVVCTVAVGSDPGGMFEGGDRVDYLDGYLLFNKPKTPQFYSSDSLSLTFDPLWWANKASYADLLVTLIVSKRNIWLLGEKTTEVWGNVGKSGFPFESQPDVFIDHGIAAKYSVAEYDNGVFWLAADRQGQGIVILGAGYSTKRVSTYAIEAEFTTYERISDAIGFTYQLSGHAFYVLTFPRADRTWSYDITTGLWHEWLWIDANGAEHRHRANCCWPVHGIPIIGDWQNGNLYALDLRVFTDNGLPIKRVRSFPHMLQDGKRLFYRQFLADFDAGDAPQQIIGTVTRLSATFSAPDGTNLSDYISDVGGGWTPLGTATNSRIIGGRLTGSGGDVLYQSAALLLKPDITAHFDVVPSSYTSVPHDTSISAIGRASGANTGYRVTVTADGTHYALTLDVLPAGTTRTVSMGTLTSGVYTVWLLLRGSNIAAQVQRSSDHLWLRSDGTWNANSGTTAAQFSDSTYTDPGSVLVGGTWPTPAPVVPASLATTVETPLSSDPNFPGGYNYQLGGGFGGPGQSFDFTDNLYYAAIFGAPNGGIAVTDLSTMHVTRTVTLTQMYVGTAYGSAPGVPWSQDIWDLTCGNGSDLFLLTGSDYVYPHLTRVNPGTMKVTGEFYLSTGAPPPIKNVAGSFGVVNKTTSHTIVAYRTNNAFNLGPMIFDGTNMAPIGMAATPSHPPASSILMPGATRGDGGCDFILVNWDETGGSGNIDIWRITVSNSLIITSTKTGTVNILSVFAPGSTLNIGQANYDATHDAIILWAQNAINGPPTWLVSANWNGTIRWTQGPLADVATVAGNRGQSQLTGTTMMIGTGSALKMLDTDTGAITFTGTVASVNSYLFEVWDAPRAAYWTYALATSGFTRIDFIAAVLPLSLAMDDLVVTATAGALDLNQISLRFSDDRGHTWGSPVLQDIGETGQYRTSLQWNRLGMARDRCFEVSWSVPMLGALQGSWVDVTPAQN